MGRRKRNTFSKALRQLKSEEIDNRIQLTETMPTNNTMGVFISMPPGAVSSTTTVTRTVWDQVLPDFDADGGGNGQDTSGLFQEDGTPRTAMPPGDTSYILGPMAAMYYGWWSGGTTTVGYIRQSDRKMVNLGTISGKLSDWDGSSFNSYGQLTLEQAVWFRDVRKKDDAGNDPDNANYRAFYPGPPSNSPDAFGRYFCTITGEPLDRSYDKDVDVPHSPTLPGEHSPEDILAAILNRIRWNKKLSKKELDWMHDRGYGYLLPPNQRDYQEYGNERSKGRPGDDLIAGLPKDPRDGSLWDGEGIPPWMDPNYDPRFPYRNQPKDGEQRKDRKEPWDGKPPKKLPPTDGEKDREKEFWGPKYPVGIAQELGKIASSLSGGSGLDGGYHDIGGGDFRNIDQIKKMYKNPNKYNKRINKGVRQVMMDLDLVHYEPKGDVLSEEESTITSASYKPCANIPLSEERKVNIFKRLKDPVVLPEGKKKSYKVNPGAKMRGMDKLIGDTKVETPFKEGQPIWSKNSQNYNTRASQEKKNQVLQYVGASMDHWDYMTDTVKKQGGKLIANYKDHDYLYNYWFPDGTRKKAVRKEEVKGDYVVCLLYTSPSPRDVEESRMPSSA